jgi:hypothetical protein
VWSVLDFSTFATRHLHVFHHARASSGGRWNCGRKMSGKFCLNANFYVTFRDLLHAVKLRHGSNGFTSPLKEGVLRIFCPKYLTALARFEPANLGTKDQHATSRPLKSLVPDLPYTVLAVPTATHSRVLFVLHFKVLIGFTFVEKIKKVCIHVSLIWLYTFPAPETSLSLMSGYAVNRNVFN